VDGPFANTTVPFLDDENRPHCLSRGFETGDGLLDHGRWFNPLALEKLLLHSDYEAFNLGLENGPHNAIPRSIQGDFLLLTAPFGESLFNYDCFNKC
jgi:tyrosinase